MFSPYLYDHKFDIDDLIAAQLAETPQHLETRTGTLSATLPEVDDAHRFILPVLPVTWLAHLDAHDEYFRLPPAERAELGQLVKTTTILQSLLPLVFGPSTLGGWLRERLKEECLQWLADNNLIPPSMRHINGVPKAKAAPAPANVKKVTIA
ncbi:MAG TPA: hypothetical protein VHP58_05830 [Alphaproteobacteria bacterium]|nr:hypothetical protein [Alphaproteobacteria bacterium]